jgi:integrase
VQEKRLSARGVVTLGKPGRHADGGGLYLVISNRGGFSRRSWLYLFTFQGKLKAMGLGPYPLISLAEARALRDNWRKVLRSGRNPIEARRSEKTSSSQPTFGHCATALLEAKSSQWKNARHRQQWRRTLETYAKPAVDKVDTSAVLSALTPVWQRAPETASRLRGRIEAVLDAAKARGWRDGENPARWRGHLDHLLARRQPLSRGHHAALPYLAITEFIDSLRGRQESSMAALALEFLILTAARSGEVLGARWAEIDLEARVWTVPAARMKAGREHRVPLPDRALGIIEKLAAVRTSEFCFAGIRRGKPLSSMSLAMLLGRMWAGKVTVHGFRSAFRDWCADVAHAPREIAEACLAHSVGSAVERSYLRSDVLERRRPLLKAWAEYCEGRKIDNVVTLGSRDVA